MGKEIQELLQGEKTTITRDVKNIQIQVKEKIETDSGLIVIATETVV